MLLYLSIFTIVLSIVLLVYNWKTNHSTLYLSLFFILASIFGIAHYLILDGHSVFWLAIFYNNFAPFMFLLGPFLYFYVRGTMERKRTLYKKDWIHFVPATIAFIGTIPYYLQSFDTKLSIANQIIQDVNAIATIEVNLFYNVGLSFALRCGFSFIYLLYCIYYLWNFYRLETKKQDLVKKSFSAVYSWLMVLLTNLLFINSCFLFLAFQAAFQTTHKSIQNGHVFYVGAGIGYSFLAFSLLLFPHILYGVPHAKRTPIKNLKSKKEILNVPEEDPFFDLSKSIMKLLDEQKPFLNPDFDSKTLALILDVPQNHLEYCITNVMKIKFSKLIRTLRIQYAKELITSQKEALISIEDVRKISKQAGFEKTSKFYIAFQKETGCSPCEYIQLLQE